MFQLIASHVEWCALYVDLGGAVYVDLGGCQCFAPFGWAPLKGSYSFRSYTAHSAVAPGQSIALLPRRATNRGAERRKLVTENFPDLTRKDKTV